MQFNIRALSPDNVVSELSVEAPDATLARHQVEARGWAVVAVATGGGARVAWQLPGRRSPRFSLPLFSESLLSLLGAGLALTEALEALAEREATGATREVLVRLLEALRAGQRFSTALAEQPQHFPPLYVGVLRAAEGTSDLPRALRRYLDYHQRLDAVRSKLVSAAIYPTILLAAGSAVSLFLVTYVVPQFASVYQGRGGDLPWVTRMMLAWGEFADSHPLLLAGLMAAALLGLATAAPRAIRGGALIRLLARLPGVGAQLHVHELSRLYLTLGMLLEGGIALVAAMEAAGGVVSVRLQPALASARAAVAGGGALAAALEAQGLCTPVSLRLLRAGERSGNLGQMLLQAAAFHDAEFSRWIDAFTKTVEPVLMATIGIAVGAIVILLYMPIFDLAGSFS